MIEICRDYIWEGCEKQTGMMGRPMDITKYRAYLQPKGQSSINAGEGENWKEHLANL